MCELISPIAYICVLVQSSTAQERDRWRLMQSPKGEPTKMYAGTSVISCSIREPMRIRPSPTFAEKYENMILDRHLLSKFMAHSPAVPLRRAIATSPVVYLESKKGICMLQRPNGHSITPSLLNTHLIRDITAYQTHSPTQSQPSHVNRLSAQNTCSVCSDRSISSSHSS